MGIEPLSLSLSPRTPEGWKMIFKRRILRRNNLVGMYLEEIAR